MRLVANIKLENASTFLSKINKTHVWFSVVSIILFAKLNAQSSGKFVPGPLSLSFITAIARTTNAHSKS